MIAARLRQFLDLGQGLVQADAVQFAVMSDLCLPLTSGYKCDSSFGSGRLHEDENGGSVSFQL